MAFPRRVFLKSLLVLPLVPGFVREEAADALLLDARNRFLDDKHKAMLDEQLTKQEEVVLERLADKQLADVQIRRIIPVEKDGTVNYILASTPIEVRRSNNPKRLEAEMLVRESQGDAVFTGMQIDLLYRGSPVTLGCKLENPVQHEEGGVTTLVAYIYPDL